MWSSTKFAKNGWIAGSFVNSASDLVLSSSSQRPWSYSRPRQELIPDIEICKPKGQDISQKVDYAVMELHAKGIEKWMEKIVHFNKKCAERAWHSLYLHFLTLWHRQTNFLTHKFHKIPTSFHSASQSSTLRCIHSSRGNIEAHPLPLRPIGTECQLLI